jgi:predicted nucleic-acid-binding Zn-ribbon protein
MPNYNECPKCGSSDIIPKQKIVSAEGGSSVEYRAIVRLRERTGTWRVKYHDHPIVAWICGGCGYTELYTAKAKELSSAYWRLQQIQSERGPTLDDELGADAGNNRAFLIVIGVMFLLLLSGILALVLILGMR